MADTEFETVQYEHPTHGILEFEAPTGLSDEEVVKQISGLDLDMLLGVGNMDVGVGETEVEKLKEWENSAGAGKREGKWYPHASLEGGTDTLAYGHKLTQAEVDSGTIDLDGTQVNWKEGLTDNHAVALLNKDATWAKSRALASLQKVGLEGDEGKVQALTSLIFNVGSGSWGGSKARRYLEAGNIEDFMHEAFSEEAGFVHVKGDKSRGLVRRRKAEAQLFAQSNIDKGDGVFSQILEAINPVGAAQAASTPQDKFAESTQGKLGDVKVPVKPGQKQGKLGDVFGQETLSTSLPVKPGVPVANTPEEKTALAPVETHATELFSATTKGEAKRALTQIVRKTTPLSLLPDNLEMMVTDVLFKNVLGLPIGGATLNENDLDKANLDVVKFAASNAIKGGRNSFTYTDYPKTKRGLSADSIVGGKGVKESDKVYSKTVAGFAKLAWDSYTDPVVTTATTIGGASIIKEGNVYYATDTYDAERFKYGSASKGWYGTFRNFLQQHGSTEDQKQTDDKIHWKIKLGTREELGLDKEVEK